ncbi:unnamed protein product [Soboliphyme baturini]|uniref:Secreted protein n=1 Tax=Soboliphyme baturini TaxID=241478 RepID=A0A183IF41_9BILA|nr:unnamed protein product [Soboliphyme baturini]
MAASMVKVFSCCFLGLLVRLFFLGGDSLLRGAAGGPNCSLTLDGTTVVDVGVPGDKEDVSVGEFCKRRPTNNGLLLTLTAVVFSGRENVPLLDEF